MLIIMHHRNIQQFFQSPLYFETPGRRNILEVDSRKRRRDIFHRRDDFLGILRREDDRDRIDTRELLEQHRLPLHDRERTERPDIPKSEHRGTIGNDGNGIPPIGKRIRLLVSFGGLERNRSHSGRIEKFQRILRHLPFHLYLDFSP